jgi:hypothetical protein
LAFFCTFVVRTPVLGASLRGLDYGAPKSPGAAAIEAQYGPGPKKSFGEVRIWTGTWNMGARDPFLEMESLVGANAVIDSMLSVFIPKGYDLYVLGVQEGISDRVFEAVEMYTGAFRLPLQSKLYPAREMSKEALDGAPKVRSRRLGCAIPVTSFIDDARAGIFPDPVTSTADMLDRVWGRGDGALLTPKYTGIAVFVSPVLAPYARLLGVYKHSFGASEGSKGGVGVAMGIYDTTIAFVNAHMASKRPEMRRAQYAELVDRLGVKLGGRGFGLNESFHHVIWMGDLNYHVKGVNAADAISAIRFGRHNDLLLQHDELLIEKEQGVVFYEYEEPLMAPNFIPTYKKVTDRGIGKIDYANDADWPNKVYITSFKEPFYKGGRVVDRIPSWTDRIQYHSLTDRSGTLLPELLDPNHPDTSAHNYAPVNEGLDCSDHSPVYATWTLQISVEEVDESVVQFVRGAQDILGYREPVSNVEDEQQVEINKSAPMGGILGGQGFLLPDADFSSIHPMLRPMIVDITLANIIVEYRGLMRMPRAVSVLFPLPFEDSDAIPERAKIVRGGSLMSLGARGDMLAAFLRTLVSRQSKLESLHLLVKVSLDDNTKAQAVVSIKDGGFIGLGKHVNMFRAPLISYGTPLLNPDGSQCNVIFQMEMWAYERGGVQTPALESIDQAASMDSPTKRKIAGTRRDGQNQPSSGNPGVDSTKIQQSYSTDYQPVAATIANYGEGPGGSTEVVGRTVAILHSAESSSTTIRTSQDVSQNSSSSAPSENEAPILDARQRAMQMMAAAKAKAAEASRVLTMRASSGGVPSTPNSAHPSQTMSSSTVRNIPSN